MIVEYWYCANCLHVGPLSSHGRCTDCNSDGVARSGLVFRRREPGEPFTSFVLRILEEQAL